MELFKKTTTVNFLILLISCLSFQVIAQHQIGHTQIDFVDPNRGNRIIQTEIYYPTATAGEDISIASGQYPVIVFGHGFVMAWSAYQNLWDEFVPRGYIMVFPRTEGNIFSTDHQQFGFDLQFLVNEIQLEGSKPTSPIFDGVAEETALMGHSMGGGAAFLAADSLCTNGNQNLKTLIGLAPAESSTNGVSSIQSATKITVPSMILSGSEDAVTPADEHHIPMYNNLAPDCKTFINVLGGAHCYFANSNSNCDFGESSSSGNISITRDQQHEITYDFVNLWLDYTLKSHCNSFAIFQDSLTNSIRIDYNQDCIIELLNSSVSVENVNCNGGSDGNATLNINGGQPPYSENWNGADANALIAGTYNVTVTDAKGCTKIQEITISEPELLSFLTSTTDVKCNGDDSGTAQLTITGGTAPYTENWDGFNPNFLYADSYIVSVSDANACSSHSNFTITEPSHITVSSTTTQASCGENDGTISLFVDGGIPNYLENWQDENPNNMYAGTYTVIVLDANNCSESHTYIINNPTPNLALQTSDATCFEGSNGNVTSSVDNGVSPYSYDWYGIDTTALVAGNYSVQVTDNAGCIVTESFTINDAPMISISATITDASCGNNDGAVTLSVSGGTAPYSENWQGDNPNTLFAGTYSPSVTDNEGCIQPYEFTVNNIGGPVVAIASTDVNCSGENTGTIQVVSITGGQSPYTIDWGGKDTSALVAGTYSVNITDNNNCLTNLSQTISEPYPLSHTISTTDVSCFGESNGSVNIIINGGTYPYQIDWGTPSESELIAGTYIVTVTDDNGCKFSDQAIINEPLVMSINAIVTDETIGSDGALSISVTGGITPYQYEWSNNATTQNLNSLIAGTYSTIVTDYNNCVIDTLFTLQDNTSPSVIIENSSSQIRWFPNPTEGNITLHLSTDTETLIIISDITGKKIFNQPFFSSTVQINLTIPAGIYFIEIKNEDQYLVEKLQIK